jgi:alkylhydroperoxidase/carboxymuconolactone decarboxylase family protein YurZ
MWRALIMLGVLTLVLPATAWANHCRWVVDPGSAADVISAVNREASSDGVIFQIYDNSGALLGTSVFSPTIPAGGRFEITVGNLYASAGVSTALVKKTYILVFEGANEETILQVKTGGGTFQPIHFDSDFSGTGNCDSH